MTTVTCTNKSCTSKPTLRPSPANGNRHAGAGKPRPRMAAGREGDRGNGTSPEHDYMRDRRRPGAPCPPMPWGIILGEDPRVQTWRLPMRAFLWKECPVAINADILRA